MRTRVSSQRLTREQLDRFLAANGLHTADGRVVAPKGEQVGAVIEGQEAVLLALFEEAYRHGDSPSTGPSTGSGHSSGHRLVRAWWPSSRPAWTIIGVDGRDVGPTLGPEEVICDFCNRQVAIRPVPVVDDHALCRACFRDLDLPFPGRVQPYVPAGQATRDE